jgi:hypothetical protein
MVAMSDGSNCIAAIVAELEAGIRICRELTEQTSRV